MRSFEGNLPVSAAAAGVNHVLGGVAGPRGGQRGVGGPGGYPGHHRAGSARSWHPSPFASDDEIAHEAAAAAASDEPQFYKVNMQAFLLSNDLHNGSAHLTFRTQPLGPEFGSGI